jgi:hypothetical protein
VRCARDRAESALSQELQLDGFGQWPVIVSAAANELLDAAFFGENTTARLDLHSSLYEVDGVGRIVTVKNGEIWTYSDCDACVRSI